MGLTFKRPEGGDKKYETHPQGSFAAICRDCYKTVDNHKFAGQTNKFGKVNPDTDEKVVIEFLTHHKVEVDGEMRNAYASIRTSPYIGDKSTLYKFLRGWFPDLDQATINKHFYGDDGLSLDGLVVGKSAMVTIGHRKDTSDPDKVWADVTAAMPIPQGPGMEALNAMVPAIPADYQRKPETVDRRKPKTADEVGADSIRDGENHPM